MCLGRSAILPYAKIPANKAISLASSSPSWSSWWKQRYKSDATVLFVAETKDIVGGKLYNTVPSRKAEYLTVTGSAGSEVYTCPATADYQTADTDRLWFLPSTTQLNVKTSDMIGFDFTRTIIKYDSESPYSIRVIMILSSDIAAGKVDRLHKDFELPIYWSGIFNDNGYLKDNRTATERYLWNLPKTIENLIFWRSTRVVELFHLTGNLINEWEDISENKYSVVASAADATRPEYDGANSKIIFVAANDTKLRHLGDIALAQPYTRILVYKKTVSADVDQYITGSAAAVSGIVGISAAGAGNFTARSNTIVNFVASNLNLNLHIVEFNGASTKYYLNNGLAITGNPGALAIDGDEVGGYNNGAASIDGELMETMLYSGILSDADRLKLKTFLQTRCGL